MKSLSRVDTSLDVDQLVASAKAAFRSPVLREAMDAPRRWSELYLATATGEQPIVVVEGIADLVFETAGGELVVVDYKTDRTLTDSSKAHYAEQLACYGELVQRVTGRPVGRRVVVHVPSNSATEYLF
jgi:ATP-dependent helicase/nuclease subunit A